MWRLYCGAKGGIAIRTTYEKLRISFPDEAIHIELVTYKDYETEGYPIVRLDPEWPPEYVDLSPFMHKRMAFEHEREVRVIKKVDATANDNCAAGIRLEWDLEKIVDAIYVNPYAGDGYLEVVEAVVEKFAPQLERLLRFSNMKREPLY